MNRERYNQIIDEVYDLYSKDYEKDNSIGLCLLIKRTDGKSTYRKPSKEMFEGLIRCDETFSDKYGFNIIERGLTLEERYNIWFTNNYETGMERCFSEKTIPDFNDSYYEPTPKKIITITYNNEILQIYE
jgi:hypothetical protein